ncbi:unnamed protein product, partial [Didymodactylos carnosus]
MPFFSRNIELTHFKNSVTRSTEGIYSAGSPPPQQIQAHALIRGIHQQKDVAQALRPASIDIALTADVVSADQRV